MMSEESQRQMLWQRLEATGKTIVPLTPEQIENFAGNALSCITSKVNWPYLEMAELDPTGGKPRQKKKSAPKKPKHRASGAPRREATAVKKAAAPPEQPVVMGRMERTRRLLLAALRVWKLKRRPLE